MQSHTMHVRSRDKKQLVGSHRRMVLPCPRLVTFLIELMSWASEVSSSFESIMGTKAHMDGQDLLIPSRFSSSPPKMISQQRRKGWVMVSLYRSQPAMIIAARRADQQISTDQLRDQPTDQNPAEIISDCSPAYWMNQSGLLFWGA